MHIILAILCTATYVVSVPLLTTTQHTSVPFFDCGSMYTLKELYIGNCKTLPCPLYMEEETHFFVNMTAVDYMPSMRQEITIIIKNIQTQTYSTPGPCSSQRPCPVSANADASFSTRLYVPDIAPFDGRLRWVIRDNNQKQIMCFEVSIVLCENESMNHKCYQ